MIRGLLGRQAEETETGAAPPESRQPGQSGQSDGRPSVWTGFALALHAMQSAAQRENSSGLEGIGLAAWDAQVRHEIEHHRQRNMLIEQVWEEEAVLEKLAALTARYRDNGPWRAAADLFGRAA